MGSKLVDPKELNQNDLRPESNIYRFGKDARYGNISVFGDNVAVRMIDDPKKIGSILVPDKKDSAHYRSCVGQVVAKGAGGHIRLEKELLWLKGSKKWDYRKVSKEIAKRNPNDTSDLNPGDYVLFLHPYVADKYLWVKDIPREDFTKFRKKDVEGESVRVALVSGFEIMCVIELEEGETEEGLSGRFSMRQISV